MKASRLIQVFWCILLVFLLAATAWAENQPTLGTTIKFGTTSTDEVKAIAKDSAGNIYLTGTAGGQLSGSTSTGGMFIAKYTSAGARLWVKQYGTINYTKADCMAVDGGDNVIVAGYHSGSSFDGKANSGAKDIIIIKLDPSGNKLWSAQYGGTLDDEAKCIAADASGNIYVGGRSYNSLDGNTNSGNADVFLAKYDSGGTKQWLKMAGSTGTDYAAAITFGQDGKLYLAGDTNGSFDGQTNHSAGYYDICLIKYETDGTKVWTKLLGTTVSDTAADIAVDPAGNYFIAGTRNTSTTLYQDYKDSCMAKYSPDGTIMWDSVSAAADWHYEFYTALALAPNGSVYVVGVKNDPSGNGWMYTDGIFRKYDSEGNMLWSMVIGYPDTGSQRSKQDLYDVFLDEGTLWFAGETGGRNFGGTDIGYDEYPDALAMKYSVIEGTPPISAITSPLDGANITATTATITGTASDASGIGYVDVSTDGGVSWSRATGTTSWSYAWTLPTAGSYNIKSRATDLVGNGETPGAGITVTVDTPPLSTITAPVELEAINPSAGSYTIAGTTVDRSGTGLSGVEVSTDSGNNWSAATNVSGNWTSWSYNWTPLPLGVYTIKARGTDNEAKTEVPPMAVTVIVDGSDPVTTLADPLDGQVISLASGTYIITGTATDAGNSGLAGVEVSTDGGSIWNTATGLASWTYAWLPTSAGNYNIRTRATDRAGNVETPGTGIDVEVTNVVHDFLWVKEYGSAASEHAMDSVTDENGNIYVTGYTGGSLDGTNQGAADVFIAKFDAGGTRLWTKQIGSTSYDYGMSIARDRSDGSLYITGYTGGNFDGLTHPSSGADELFLVKYDADGNKIWSYIDTNTDVLRGRAVAVGNGYIFVAANYLHGETWGKLFKFDKNGGLLRWDSLVYSYTNDWIYDVFADDAGNVYVAGSADGDAVVGTASWFYYPYIDSGMTDAAYGVVADADGNLYVAGETYGDMPGNTNAGEMDPFTGEYTADIFLAKYDPYGNVVWIRQFGTPFNDRAYSLAIDSEGTLYLTGKTESGLDGNSSAGGHDFFVTRFNSDGVKLFTQQLGSSSVDQAYSVTVDDRDNAIITGSTYGTLPGQTWSGGYDTFVAKLGKDLTSYITNRKDGEYIPTQSFAVSGKAFDYSGNGIQTVDVYVDGAWSPATDTSGNGSWATWSYTTAPLALGSYTLRSRATDTLDNVESPTPGMTVTVDDVFPSSAITYPLGGILGSLACTVTGTASDTGSGLLRVEVSTNGGNTWNTATGTSSWSYAWTIAGDGTYNIRSRAVDKAGNTETPGAGVTVPVDVTPPTFALTSHANNAWVRGVSVVLSGTADDGAGSGVAIVHISFGGDSWAVATDTSGGTWASWSYTWTLPADGSYTVRVVATDYAGNAQTPASLTFKVDNTAPTAVMSSPASGATITSTGETISGTASDGTGSGLQGVEVSTDNGSTWGVASGTTTWTYSWTVPAAGPYTLKVKTTDAVGNVNTSAATRDVTAKSALALAAGERSSLSLNCNTNWPAPMTEVAVSASPWPVDLAASGSQPWLTGQAATSGAPVRANVNMSGLANGTHSADLTISSAYATNTLTVSVSLTATNAAPGPELQHTNWSPSLTGGSCSACHATVDRFLASDFSTDKSFCASCHNAGSVGHGKNPAASHPVMVNATSGIAKMPTYGNITAGEYNNQMFANLRDGKVVCATCHNVMRKGGDAGRKWETTARAADDRTFHLSGGGWANYGRAELKVYRYTGSWAGPTYSRDKKGYLVAPSEYTYNEAVGSIIFNSAQTATAYVYADLDYPYLRVGPKDNALCLDCHTEATHKNANCLDCHQAHDTTNIKGIRGTVRTTDRSERTVVFSRATGASSFADGDTTYDGVCEVCHTTTKYHRRDGGGFVNHSSGVNRAGSDCASCHTHSSGFSRY